MKSGSEKISWKVWLPLLLFLGAIFLISGYLFHNQTFNSDRAALNYVSDLPAHIEFAQSIKAGGDALPHPGLHLLIIFVADLLGIGLACSAVLVLAGFVTLLGLIVFLILYWQLKELYPISGLIFLTGTLMLVTAVYAPFFSRNIYLGQGSPNIWHNPTITAVKPFAFLTVILYLQLIERNNQAKETVVLIILTALTLLLSVYIKPNFALIFVPAVFLYVLYKNWRDFSLYWQSIIVLIPVAIVLAFQFLNTFYSNDIQSASIFLDLFGVWRIFSSNIFVSILLALAFPLSLTLFRLKEAFKNPYFVFSWILVIVGILQFALLAESGERYNHANWSWGYNIALQVLFVFAVVELAKWLKMVPFEKKHGGDMLQKGIVLTLFTLHFLSGVFYFVRILGGGVYS